MTDQSSLDLPSPSPTVDQVLGALRQLRLGIQSEEISLQDRVAERLAADGIPYQREHWIGPREKIDFLCGTVGVECKRNKPNGTQLLGQLERYCKSSAVSAIIVVVPWGRHLYLPSDITGKPIHLLSLNKLWGVAF